MDINNDTTTVLPPKTIRSLGFVDQFELEEKLGEGGFGSVYRARDTVSNVDVAIKGLPGQVRSNKQEMENVMRNFQLVHGLIHENIAAALFLHQAEEVKYFDDSAKQGLRVSRGDKILVMQYVPGIELGAWRQTFPNGKVPFPKAIEIVRQIASALDYAHSERVIHRDIKPSNVMVDEKTERVSVLDFGLAAEIHTSLSRVTGNPEVRERSGTRQYMSPEQWTGDPQGNATDLYALAVVFVELLTGEVPFASVFSGSDVSVMRAAVTGQPYEPPKDFPLRVRLALKRALAKDPGHRFRTCKAFVDALEQPLWWRWLSFAVKTAVVVVFVGVAISLLMKSLDKQPEPIPVPQPPQPEPSSNVLTNAYSITYDLAGGLNDLENPDSYRQCELPLRLGDPVRPNYKFVQWEPAGVIESGQRGNRHFTAKWQPLTFKIDYVLNGGTNAAGNPRFYTVEDSFPIVLEKPTRNGYDFAGWSSDGIVAVGSCSNLVFTAKWHPHAYRIEYRLSGGTFTNAPRSYTVEKLPLRLSEPAKTGFLFDGWEPKDRISIGETGDRRFTAKWKEPPPDKISAAEFAALDVTGLRPGKCYEVLLPRDVSILMVWCGSANARGVESGGFWIGKYEVSQKLWFGIMRSNPSQYAATSEEMMSRMPVESVTWEDCNDFVRKLNQLCGVKGFRLPSEREWEFACRAGTDTEYSWGDAAGAGNMRDLESSSSGTGGGPVEVDRYKPNAWGIFNMHGNVGEWCSDLYDSGKSSDEYVLRGGGWNMSGRECGASHRRGCTMWNGDDECGLRLCFPVIVEKPRDLLRKMESAGETRPKQVPSQLQPADGESKVSDDAVTLSDLGQTEREEAPDASVREEAPDAPVKVKRARLGCEAGEVLSVVLSEGLAFDLSWCPSGEFVMGSPATELKRNSRERQHKVVFTNGFWLARHEVSAALWADVMGENSIGGHLTPKSNVSWNDCQLFVDRLNRRLQQGALSDLNLQARLPTEAEWEYACRAGSTTAFSFGAYCDGVQACCDGTSPYGTSKSSYRKSGPDDIGRHRNFANAWNLEDMHGNLAEWCLDAYRFDLGGETVINAPVDDDTNGNKVVRGGNWMSGAENCRSASRSRMPQNQRNSMTGFRFCCEARR